jgi:hypothetical protein
MSWSDHLWPIVDLLQPYQLFFYLYDIFAQALDMNLFLPNLLSLS